MSARGEQFPHARPVTCAKPEGHYPEWPHWAACSCGKPIIWRSPEPPSESESRDTAT